MTVCIQYHLVKTSRTTNFKMGLVCNYPCFKNNYCKMLRCYAIQRNYFHEHTHVQSNYSYVRTNSKQKGTLVWQALLSFLFGHANPSGCDSKTPLCIVFSSIVFCEIFHDFLPRTPYFHLQKVSTNSAAGPGWDCFWSQWLAILIMHIKMVFLETLREQSNKIALIF